MLNWVLEVMALFSGLVNLHSPSTLPPNYSFPHTFSSLKDYHPSSINVFIVYYYLYIYK